MLQTACYNKKRNVPKDIRLAPERQQLVLRGELRLTLRVRLEVSKVAYVTRRLGVCGSTVSLVVRVEVSPGGGASSGEVTEFTVA